MGNERFYENLESFSTLSAIVDLQEYKPVPEDWVVLATDIVRSGEAVARGRYKQVNLVGAAVISAVLNRLGRDRIPFIFGGDGAILLVPSTDAEAGKGALAGVALLAAVEFDLDLRCAAIPVSHLRAKGTDIRLRKYALSPGNYLAMAVGGGLALADEILKDPKSRAAFEIAAAGGTPTLDGLSCRWDPVPSRRGRIVSLILRPAAEALLSDILDGLQDAIGFDPLSEAPRDAFVQPDKLKYRFRPGALLIETRLAATGQKLRKGLRALLESLGFLFASTTGKPLGTFEARRYLDEISLNTDHRKLDDSLRLVLDLTEEQIERLSGFLHQAEGDRRLDYGMHVSRDALMTCFVTDVADGRHIHFIDGGDGGLSMAGADYKARVARRLRETAVPIGVGG